MRGLVVYTTGRNEFNRRQYMILADVLEQRGLEFNLVFQPDEDMSVPHAKRFLASKLLRQKAKLPGGVIHNYRLFSKNAAGEDVREKIRAVLASDRARFREMSPAVVAMFDEADWIFTGFGILTTPWLCVGDPRVVQFTRCSLLQIPRRTIPDWRPRVAHHPANYMLVARGPILGESDLARDPEAMRKELQNCNEAEGSKILGYLKDHKHTGDTSEHSVPKPKSWDRTVFVVLHCAWDAQLIRFSPLFGTNYDFLKFVLENLPQDWQAIVKPHPKAASGLAGQDPAKALIQESPNAILCRCNFHDVVPRVRKVVCVNSSVGLEAMTYRKQVLVAGHATYAHIPGASVPCYTSKDVFAKALAAVGDGAMPELATIHRAFDFFWNRYLVPSDPIQKWQARTAKHIDDAVAVRSADSVDMIVQSRIADGQEAEEISEARTMYPVCQTPGHRQPVRDMSSSNEQGATPQKKEQIDGTGRRQNTQTRPQEGQEEDFAPSQENQNHGDTTRPALTTIVLACGGPSLRNVNWSALPFPVAAINKAILVAPRFDYWFMADGYPERIYKDRWQPVAADARIAKCVPHHRLETGYAKLKRIARNLHAVPTSQGRTQDKTMTSRGRRFFDGRVPLFYVENKTTLFATQWLAIGYKRLIYVGCELAFEGSVGSCVGSGMHGGEVNQMHKNLELVKRGLKALHIAAVDHGIQMLSFSPGPINDIMSRYEP